MNRARIAKLAESVWFRPFDSDPLEVELVPSGMPELRGMLWGINTDNSDQRVCQRAFIGFRNYTENDGDTKDLPNTLETRLELWRTPAVRQAIVDRLQVLNSEVVQGEASAVSA